MIASARAPLNSVISPTFFPGAGSRRVARGLFHLRRKWGEIFLQIFSPHYGDGVDIAFGAGRQLNASLISFTAMAYYWTTDPNWFQVVLTGCTVSVNLLGAAVLGVYTWETVKLRRSTEKQQVILNKQFGMSISPGLNIRNGPHLVTSDMKETRERGVLAPYTLIRITNEGPQVGLRPLAILRLNSGGESFDCRVEYGLDGISAGESLDFIINKRIEPAELNSLYKSRFRGQRPQVLGKYFGSTSPFLAIFCMDRSFQVHAFRWEIKRGTEPLVFTVASYVEPDNPYLEEG
jgi:hypothetical protein